jgi:hypothetical protein
MSSKKRKAKVPSRAPEQPQVHQIYVQLEPAKDDFPGRVFPAWFIIEGDRIVMTGENGNPIINDRGGRYEIELSADHCPETLASIKARDVRSAFLGAETGFNKPINYQRASVA